MSLDSRVLEAQFCYRNEHFKRPKVLDIVSLYGPFGAKIVARKPNSEPRYELAVYRQ